MYSITVHTTGGSNNDSMLFHGEGTCLCEAEISCVYLYRDSCSPCPVSVLQAGAPDQNRDIITVGYLVLYAGW